MSLEKNFKNVNDSLRIIKMTIVLTFFLNLSTIHEWLQQKEASTNTARFLKLTQALNDLGNDFHLNVFRDSIRSKIFKKPLAVGIVPEMNPMTPDLPATERDVAAIEIPAKEDEMGIDLGEIDVIDDILEDKSDAGRNGVLIIGDSILKSGLQEHFERNLSKREVPVLVEVKSQSGTGLSRPDVFDWINYVDKTKEQFGKVIVFLGTNDAQNLVVNKKVIPFDSKEWRAEYASRVRALVSKACAKSNEVYWVGALKMKSDTFDARLKSLHDVVNQELKSTPSCARFLPVANWFTRKAKYTDTWTTESKKEGKKTIKLRVPDGIHLTYWGADLFSKRLIETIYE